MVSARALRPRVDEVTPPRGWSEIGLGEEADAAPDRQDLPVNVRGCAQTRTCVRLRVQYCRVMADRPALLAGESHGRRPIVPVCPVSTPGTHLLGL